MSDEIYSIPAEPVYHDAVRMLKNGDPIDADEVINPLIQAMLENTHFVRLLAEAIAAQNAADHATIRQETAASIQETGNALSAHAGKRDNPHGVTAAQVGAAVENHGTHVSYSATVPKIDGTASAGSAATVARSDHVHPTDTSRAAASHTHSKSQITDFPASMPASDVPAWAKAANKPAYTASEVGAAAANHTHNYAAPGHTHTAAQVGALPSTGGTLTGPLTIGKMKMSWNASASCLDFEVV